MPPTESDSDEGIVVPSASGPLNAIVSGDLLDDAVPGVVLVDGSGDGSRHDWSSWPTWIREAGAVVLRHDKPGCGGSPGRWQEQTLQDRAEETLAAVTVLRDRLGSGADPDDLLSSRRPVGLYGVSQGGWVALLAAAAAPQLVDFVVCHSGPGVGPRQQEHARIQAELRGRRLSDADVMAAMSWVEQRADRLAAVSGPEDAGAITALLEQQATFAGQPWFAAVTRSYETVSDLGFLAGIIDFDPAAAMAGVACPVLALFGGRDAVVDASTNVAVLATHLPPSPAHGIVVFPGADHGLFVADPDPAVPRAQQLAPAYMPVLGSFLADRRR